ncbi:hypothetical protein VP01_7021g1, partial [Puccinia sorghi]
NIKKLVSIKLSTKEVLREEMFALESNSSKQETLFLVNHCQKTGTQIDNEMTIIEKQLKFSYNTSKLIEHFMLFKCTAHWRRTVSHHIQHSNTNSYILNSYSHSTTRWNEVLFDEKVQPISKKYTKPQEGFIPIE